MKTTIAIQKAGKADFDAICQLLSEGHLPVSDLNPLLENFFVAVENKRIIAVMGMDKYGNAGLLRSAMVMEEYRGTGIAGDLVTLLIVHAKECGVVSMYLITNTAEKYFEKKGFIKIDRGQVPGTVLQSKEFNGLCPASAVIMCRKL